MSQRRRHFPKYQVAVGWNPPDSPLIRNMHALTKYSCLLHFGLDIITYGFQRTKFSYPILPFGFRNSQFYVTLVVGLRVRSSTIVMLWKLKHRKGMEAKASFSAQAIFLPSEYNCCCPIPVKR